MPDVKTIPTARALIIASTTAALALLGGSSLDAGGRISMRVAPRIATAPATVNVHAVAEPDPANRSLQVQLNSQDYYRSSMIPLEGEAGPRTTMMQYEGVPGGTYEVRVTLFGADGKPRASTFQDVTILSLSGR
jgi:hypothetical protein